MKSKENTMRRKVERQAVEIKDAVLTHETAAYIKVHHHEAPYHGEDDSDVLSMCFLVPA